MTYPVYVVLLPAVCAALPVEKPTSLRGSRGSIRGSRASAAPGAGPQRFRTYAEAREHMEKERIRLKRMYRAARSKKARKRILEAAGQVVAEGVAEGLLPFWYGTSWNFNGTTRIPGKGSIACGYLVSTLLQHAGFKVSRALLGQQPSSYIIKTLTRYPHIKGTSRFTIQRFVDLVRRMGEGLYIVGLDWHTGFIRVRKGRVLFIHASYIKPMVVREEDALTSTILSASKYRIVGHISADPLTMINWLFGGIFKTVRMR